jgi:hypothetical protein
MIECPIFWISPTPVGDPDPPVDDVITCSGCNCGYIQYEHLLSYLPEVDDALKADPEKYKESEFKLRQQITEISRLFDIDAGVAPGFFSKAHYKTTKVFPTNGTRFIRIPDFVKDTLEVRTLEDIVIDPNSYGVENNHLVFMPCLKHVRCGCPTGCNRRRCRRHVEWPNGCYKVTARWGKECADYAVQMAVRDYLIELYRMRDPVVVLANGLQVQRNFTVPHSWSTYVTNFKNKRAIFSRYAFA